MAGTAGILCELLSRRKNQRTRAAMRMIAAATAAKESSAGSGNQLDPSAAPLPGTDLSKFARQVAGHINNDGYADIITDLVVPESSAIALVWLALLGALRQRVRSRN